jgi:hypothetical protein
MIGMVRSRHPTARSWLKLVWRAAVPRTRRLDSVGSSVIAPSLPTWQRTDAGARPQVADNLSPLQRLAVECFEDCRIDHLVLRCYPGLRHALLELHPAPAEDACDPQREACLRHRLVCLSRALLDAAHPYRDPVLLEFRGRFHELLREGESSTQDMAALAIKWAARTRRQSDQQAKMRFDRHGGALPRRQPPLVDLHRGRR